MSRYILILQTGQPIKQALDKYGDFDELFIKGMNINKSLTKTIHVYDDVNFPNPEKLAGIIITGSPSMVTECHSWCQKTQQWIQQFLETDLPILGVCYGHQLLAKALGGSVEWNPKGREIGQIDMMLEQDAYKDVLLSSVVTAQTLSLNLQATHQQAVTYLPSQVKILGKTLLDSHHCFCYKNHVWGMQFHPEFSPEIIKDYIHLRYYDVKKEGLNPEQMMKDVEDIHHGSSILQKFAQICFQRNSIKPIES